MQFIQVMKLIKLNYLIDMSLLLKGKLGLFMIDSKQQSQQSQSGSIQGWDAPSDIPRRLL